MKDYVALFSNRKFLALWLSQFLSQIAINTLNFLVILKVYSATGSSVATSLVWLVFIIPAILLGPIASAFVDLVDRRNVLITANLAQSSIILFYALVHGNVFYLSYGVVLVYSIFNQFYIPAEVASLPGIVRKEKLAMANGLFLATYQLGLVGGFGLSGLVGELFGFTSAFIFAAGLLFIAFLSVLSLPSLNETDKRIEFNIESIRNNIDFFINNVLEGFMFIKSKKEIFLPFLAIAILQVSLAVSFVLLPEISIKLLLTNPNYSGLLIVTPVSIGAVIGIIIVPKFLKRMRKKVLIKRALWVIAFQAWFLVLGIKLIPDELRLYIAFIYFIILGCVFINIFIPAQTHLQVATPKRMMGRVFGNVWFITTVATVFPMIFSATITEVLGVRALIGIMGVLLVIVLVNYDKYV